MDAWVERGAAAYQGIATAVLALFLVAVVVALVITLDSVAPPARTLSVVVVSPIVALTLLFLYFELRGRPWSFAGAAALGALGVCLRLFVSTQPQLEVGGGLPLAVNVFYLALGTLVVVSNLQAYAVLGRAGSV